MKSLYVLPLFVFICSALHSQNIGIGTTTPHTDALLHVDLGTSTTKGLLVNGTYNVASTVPNLGAGSRLTFYPGWAAFRAGRVDGSQWNFTNVGLSSTAFGYNTIAVGQYSTALGHTTTASGGNSFATGFHTTASGTTSFTAGALTIAASQNCMAVGSTTRARGYHSFSGGLGTVAKGFASMAIGMFNDSVIFINETAPVTGSPLFMIGNGTADNARSNALVVLSNANTGIGTSAPQRKLHVFNGSYGGSSPNANSHFILENSTHNYLSILAPSASEKGIIFGDELNENDGGIFYSGAANGLQFRTNGNVTRMALSNAGNLSIDGTTISFGSAEQFSDGGSSAIASNSDLLPLTDNTRRLGNSTTRWTEVWSVDGTINTSDAREKENIRALGYGLKEIMQLKPAMFNWKNRASEGDKIGLMAQDLQKVLPEVVRAWEYRQDAENGEKKKVQAVRLGVMYADMVPVLVKGMQEQQAIIEALKKENEDLKARLERIEKLLANGERSDKGL
jgi:hypothetical protein